MNGLRGWFHDFPNKCMMADGGHIEFRKMLISVLDEDICTYWYKDATRPRGDVHVTKNGTGSLFAWRHQSNFGNKCRSFSAVIRYIWAKFGTELKKRTTITAKRQAAILKFAKMSSLDWTKIFPPNLMERCTCTAIWRWWFITWTEIKTKVNLREVISLHYIRSPYRLIHIYL